MGKNDHKKIAFALGGLAGSNAHGAGFLHTAKQMGIKPDIISCTSGMIWWTYNYLINAELDKLMAQVEKNITKFPKPFDYFSGLKLALFGIPNVCRPAFAETMIGNLLKLPPLSKDELFNRVFPARTLVPVRGEKFYKDISDAFNNSEIGIMFNSYNPSTGYEYIHVNDAARALLPDDIERDYHKRLYKPITPDYVCAALWVFQYGFNRSFHGEFLIDGAYVRQFIIQELSSVDTIIIARPLSSGWVGDLPKNAFEVEDFKTEMLFNASYVGELHTINVINHLLKLGKVSLKDFKHIDLVEIEMSFNRGFFDYFFESKEVFDIAVNQSRDILKAYFQN